jgi:hypothetical protein
MFFDLTVIRKDVFFTTPLMVHVFAVFNAVQVLPAAETTVEVIADPPVLVGKVNVTLMVYVVDVALNDEIDITVGAVGVVTFVAACTTVGTIENKSAHAVTSFAETFMLSP